MKTTLTTVIAILGLGSLLGSGCMPYSTGPTEIGVRTIKWSPTGNKGVEDKKYSPGSTFFFVPFLTDWHTFDTRIQKLEMSASVTRGDRMVRDDLRFKTIDGNDISLDVIISYRIDPDKGPMILQRVGATDAEIKDNIVRTIGRSKPRDIFGELKTEDFYQADLRSAQAVLVREKLNEFLQAYGVIVTEVLLQDYNFTEAYQQAIEEKKIADQQAEKLRSETFAVEEEYKTLVKEAEAEIAKVRAAADGEYERAKIEADAHYLQQEKLAEAILAEAEAEAEGIQKMNEALSGAGAMEVVKLAIADALQGKKIV
ncbi:MAG: prohibitin family protein, partial [Candidatus Hydrogenedentes bacterium]|nr:prohibitin family protein [Candidatus Hydrogenedentota bacterium]